MHYSRLLLNPQSAQVRRDLADDHQMHRTVMSAFAQLKLPENGPQRQRVHAESVSILWRVDHDVRRGVVMLIVQSDIAPNWQPLLERCPGYVMATPDSDAPTVSTMERSLSLRVGQHLRFRLRANPTRKVRVESRKNGQRKGLTTPDEQRAWLERKLGDCTGLQLISCDIIPDPSDRRSREHRYSDRGGVVAAQSQKITHVAVLFEGVVEVVDPMQVAQTLRAGIGSAKAFGFGLLSLAPR